LSFVEGEPCVVFEGIRLDTCGFDHPRVERLVGDERALDVDGEAVSFLQSLGAERRRSRTDRAVGYTTALVLKVR
jgi:hypothetical protein